MKLIINGKYFGGDEHLKNFVDNVLKEIDEIETEGKKNSKMPDRFLSDCYPGMSSLKTVFEDFKIAIDKHQAILVFETGEER